jgi:hypothetical protein
MKTILKHLSLQAALEENFRGCYQETLSAIQVQISKSSGLEIFSLEYPSFVLCGHKLQQLNLLFKEVPIYIAPYLKLGTEIFPIPLEDAVYA